MACIVDYNKDNGHFLFRNEEADLCNLSLFVIAFSSVLRFTRV